ncbi:MAG: helix-turn-helix domain-containing protein [Bacteroides sp.]
MGNYDDMLKRLVTYRKSLGLLQKQIGGLIGLSQEQYSYLESGTTKITDKNLKAFSDVGMNIDYLLTGKNYDYSAEELDEVLGEFNGTDRNFAMKMLAEVIVERFDRIDITERENVAEKNIRLLTAISQSWNDFSMINFVREEQNCSQIEMAQRLGIGIKKYRDIERENRYPDAEILVNLYSMSGYQPTLFMNVQDRRLMAIKMIWVALKSDEKKNIINFIKAIKKLV